MRTTLRTVIALGLLVATLALTGCHDGLYSSSFGYGYSGAALVRPGPYYRGGYGHTYGRHGYYDTGRVPYGDGGHHRHRGQHSPYRD